ncbi:putative DCC family thiol-disulfide oxidoreductase YuxK [Maribacter spongiicola]|uniref:Putative DCC family thiol-disulfide oxidoreductase YuxK n=1 Tax=Maribacter spongiicola TaxID=1206753 RepID=A0A4V3ERY8_9FLAO|nr:DCC1-like thiol-disulfide oxidoreductase family protein [Maribacter spongiicola]TDT45388.1 putative DCC family thiol-disulfide oxidoreductase YuxK [Maribacter spongiicola]
MNSNKKIILFDGVCNLCNNSVQFAIKRDKNDIFRYAAIQSETGKKLLKERNIDTNEVDSIILIEPNIAYYTKSTAALEICKDLKGLNTVSTILLWLPESFRNIVYDFVAANRYKWYGKKDACMIPTEELKSKFI